SRMRRLGLMLNSCHDPCHVALVDVKGFEPCEVSVTVRDGKVTVTGEHTDEHCTALTRTCNVRKFMQEFCLPPGVEEDEVSYGL
ncbi:ODFP1 protein, partial [Malurus elegans]|nr:ODFP1 protein [Malurus elegans]